ncbi:MAG: hypothetical protein ACYTG5_12040 [Planctomycetota bacterium]
MRPSTIVISTFAIMRLTSLCSFLLILTLGCQGPLVRLDTGSPSFTAEGSYVRHLRLRLDPAHTQDFEALIARCLQAAKDAELPAEYSWFCYRESPGRYWLLSFSESADGFAIPRGRDPLISFAQHLAVAAGEEAVAKIDELLDGLSYEIEWLVLMRQKIGWSTVERMSPDDNPKARMMLRRVREGMTSEFDAALAARTAFLKEQGYPLPIEGFATVIGDPRLQFQVTFPRDWSSFYAQDSFKAFTDGLDADAQAAYAERKAALMQCMDLAEYFDGDFLAELSYRPE